MLFSSQNAMLMLSAESSSTPLYVLRARQHRVRRTREPWGSLQYNEDTQNPGYSKSGILKIRDTQRPWYSKSAMLKIRDTQNPGYLKSAILKIRHIQNLRYSKSAILKICHTQDRRCSKFLILEIRDTQELKSLILKSHNTSNPWYSKSAKTQNMQ